jgi:Arc/MetJ family transcription regulator
MMVCMRTTLNLDDDLIARAQESTGVKEKTRLLHLGLEALIQRESARRGRRATEDAGGAARRTREVLPISKARGGLVKGFRSVKEASAAAELEADREQVR